MPQVRCEFEWCKWNKDGECTSDVVELVTIEVEDDEGEISEALICDTAEYEDTDEAVAGEAEEPEELVIIDRDETGRAVYYPERDDE